MWSGVVPASWPTQRRSMAPASSRPRALAMARTTSRPIRPAAPTTTTGMGLGLPAASRATVLTTPLRRPHHAPAPPPPLLGLHAHAQAR